MSQIDKDKNIHTSKTSVTNHRNNINVKNNTITLNNYSPNLTRNNSSISNNPLKRSLSLNKNKGGGMRGATSTQRQSNQLQEKLR